MAKKQQYSVSLVGMIDGIAAKTHQADDVVNFIGLRSNGKIIGIDHSVEGSPVLTTDLGKHPLIWNNAGYFEPKHPIKNVKIHVMLKKTVGKLTYWA